MNAPRKLGWLALTAGLLGVAAGCTDRFFAPGAPSRARLVLVAALAPAGGSAAAFDRADAIRVRVGLANAAVLDTTFAFRSAGTDTRVLVPIAFDSTSLLVRIDVELRAGTQSLFSGSTSATLAQGQVTPVNIDLNPVAAALVVGPMPTFAALGDTGWARGAVVFATGDTIRTLRPTWEALTPSIVTVGPDSMLVARAEGQGQIRAAYGSLMQYVPVPVNVIVASLYLTPRDPSPGVGPYTIQFTTAVRDRRGNALTRKVTYVSRNTAVVTIDSTGLARPVTLGKTWIVASVGSVSDSTTFTVGGVTPPPPAALAAALSTGDPGATRRNR